MKKLILKYNLAIFLVVLFFIGILIYSQGVVRQPTLNKAILTDFEIICSDREKSGKRYLWIKSEGLNLLSSFGRIANCSNYVGKEYSSLEVVYTIKNDKIYSLKLGSDQIISEKSVKKHIVQTMTTAYVFICIIISGLYYGFRRQLVRKEGIDG